ncbi:hypothetical protein HDU85_006035 [Gaertneriomyces sp. JEL0708]|nr:hypothetical protein HDU85_006035 [Gaertneriomyces sp. JEL0708]
MIKAFDTLKLTFTANVMYDIAETFLVYKDLKPGVLLCLEEDRADMDTTEFFEIVEKLIPDSILFFEQNEPIGRFGLSQNIWITKKHNLEGMCAKFDLDMQDGPKHILNHTNMWRFLGYSSDSPHSCPRHTVTVKLCPSKDFQKMIDFEVGDGYYICITSHGIENNVFKENSEKIHAKAKQIADMYNECGVGKAIYTISFHSHGVHCACDMNKS